MKKTYITIVASLFALGAANAAISFSTTAAAGLRDNLGTTNIASGSLVMLVVDTDGNGFLNNTINTSLDGTTAIGSISDPKLTPAEVSTTTGQLFGGDQILGVFAAAGGGSIAPGLTNVSIAGLENKRFALVWFQKPVAQLDTPAEIFNQFYGIASGADWTLPASDSGAYTFNSTTNTTTSVYWQLASTTNATQIGTEGFFTGSGVAGTDAVKFAGFKVIPEPSAALLGAFGVLGLLRRRRN